MVRMIRNTGLLLAGLLILFAVVFITRGQTHANLKHVEAETVRSTWREGACGGQELYFSPRRGTILVLCYLEGSAEWGGIVMRVTENNGSIPLSPEEAYEASCFVGTRSYWQNVIVRDGYALLHMYPSVKALWDGGYWQ